MDSKPYGRGFESCRWHWESGQIFFSGKKFVFCFRSAIKSAFRGTKKATPHMPTPGLYHTFCYVDNFSDKTQKLTERTRYWVLPLIMSLFSLSLSIPFIFNVSQSFLFLTSSSPHLPYRSSWYQVKCKSGLITTCGEPLFTLQKGHLQKCQWHWLY